MSRAFYPLLEGDAPTLEAALTYPARIAVYDDAAAAPRVVVIDPTDVRTYLEEITAEVNRLSHEQGGSIPFMVIREIVENFVHAYFVAPTISILDGGNTIRFSDQGPGIKEKERALEYGTTSATEEMKQFIRGVGSGLPYVNQYMIDKGGSLKIEDNISEGTVITISTCKDLEKEDSFQSAAPTPQTPSPSDREGLSERSKLVLEYLKTHSQVGPTELCRSYGRSLPTWSRELANLEAAGILEKGAQKYHLKG